jgi:hypothetical protein
MVPYVSKGEAYGCFHKLVRTAEWINR